MTVATASSTGWQGRLELHYQRDGERTIAHDRHHGPLRVLQRLYPEGDAICHHVLVHPPGGIVGGDGLQIDVRLDAGSHALITTPGATRFYRSAGATASQQIELQLADGARLEWLPMESIAHPGCIAENRLRFQLSGSAEMMGWDVLALGLPASAEPFDRGSFVQHLERPGVWRERGRIAGDDTLLLDSPLGLAGHRVMATLWLAAGSAIERERAEALSDAARAVIADGSLPAGLSAPDDSLLVLRALADRVEPAMQLLKAVWAAWRPLAWGLAATPPRLWRT